MPGTPTLTRYHNIHTRDTAPDPSGAEGWNVSTIVDVTVGILAFVVAVPSAVLTVKKLRKVNTHGSAELGPWLPSLSGK